MGYQQYSFETPSLEVDREEYSKAKKASRGRLRVRERQLLSAFQEEQREDENFKTFEELLAEEQGKDYHRLIGTRPWSTRSSTTSPSGSDWRSSPRQRRKNNNNKRRNKSKLPLPATQEQATWKILDWVNHSDWSAETTWHSEAIQIARIFPAMKRETFFSKDFGAMPLFHHLVAGNASVDNLQAFLNSDPEAFMTPANKSSSSIYPLHIACQCADGDTILFLARKHRGALHMMSNIGLPLHHTLKRDELDLNILKTVVRLNPRAVVTPDANGRNILEWSILEGLDKDILEYLVGEIPNSVKELALVEYPEDEPWDLSEHQMSIISKIFPRLERLTVKIKHWQKDGILCLFETLTDQATELRQLCLDIPDDFNFRYWNSGVLETLQVFLESSNSLQDLTICICDKIQSIIADATRDHDDLFQAITASLSPSLDRMEFQNVSLSQGGLLREFICQKAPKTVKFVDLSVRDRTWTRSSSWDKCRIQQLTLEGRCQINCFNAFLWDLYNDPCLEDVTLNLVEKNHEDSDEKNERNLSQRHLSEDVLPMGAYINQTTIDRLSRKGVIVRTSQDDKHKNSNEIASREEKQHDHTNNDEIQSELSFENWPQRSEFLSYADSVGYTNDESHESVESEGIFPACVSFLCCYVGPI